MLKDDYIRFRCSTDLKALAGKQAEEKGMNITEYMEYLIRKDRNNMMYVFECDEIENSIKEKIVNNGLAVMLTKDLLLAKVEEFAIDGQVIKSEWNLEEYLTWFDGGEYVSLIDDVSIEKSSVIDVLIGELYEPYNDVGMTYAESIYNAENPYAEIEKLINEFLLLCIDFKMTDIKSRVIQITKQVETGNVEWE